MKPRNHFFTILRTLHRAMLAALSLFAILTFIIVQKQTIAPVDESWSRTLQLVAVVISLVMLYPGFRLFKRKIIAVRNSRNPTEQRIVQYRSACLLWWSMIEIPGLVTLLCYVLTANLSFLFLAILHFLILLLFTPRKENIYLLLNLSSQEISRLEKAIS